MVYTGMTRRGRGTSSYVARVLVAILVILMCCAGSVTDVSAASAAFKIEYVMMDGVNNSLSEVSKPFLNSYYGGKVRYDYTDNPNPGDSSGQPGGSTNPEEGEDGETPTDPPSGNDEGDYLTLSGSDGMTLNSVLTKMGIQNELVTRLEFTDGIKLSKSQIDGAILVRSADRKNYYILYKKDKSGKYTKATDVNNLEVLYYKKPSLLNSKNKSINSINMETKTGSYSVKLNVKVPDAFANDFRTSAKWTSSDTKNMTVNVSYGEYNEKSGTLPVTLNYNIYRKGKAKLTATYRNVSLLSQSVTTTEKKQQSNSSGSTTGRSSSPSYSYRPGSSSYSRSYSSSSSSSTTQSETVDESVEVDEGLSSDALYGVDVPENSGADNSELEGLDVDTTGYAPYVGGALALMLLGGGATAAGSFNLQTAGSVLGKTAAKKKAAGKAAGKTVKTAGAAGKASKTAETAVAAGKADSAGKLAGVAGGTDAVKTKGKFFRKK